MSSTIPGAAPASRTRIFTTSPYPGSDGGPIAAYHYRRGGTPVPPSNRSLTEAERLYAHEMRSGLPITRPPSPTEDEFGYISYMRSSGRTWGEIGAALDRSPSWLCHTFHRERRQRGA